MTETTRETITTQSTPTQTDTVATVNEKRSGSATAVYILYFLLAILEVMLAFRLVLKLLGASSSSAFVRFIYQLTSVFIMPFEGIFRRGVGQGIETSAVFEPATLAAMIVYALLAWGIVKLIMLFSGERQTE